MSVLKLVLAYDGTNFRGFARQPGVRTIQGALEDALGRMLGNVPRLSVAGRTDAGVHAAGQVVSFGAEEEPDRIKRGLNGMLAPEVVCLGARRAPKGFDARQSASAREYRYRIRTEAVPNPFTARYEWHRPGAYPLVAMRRAAKDLVGTHDFRSFCRVTSGASTVRRLERLSLARRNDIVEIRARADGFLHQMVRSLVGTLVSVGEGKLDPDSMPSVLAARSRSAAGPVAPPHGLTLVRVTYGARPEILG